MSYKGYKGIGPKKYGCNKSTNPESPAKFAFLAALPALIGGGGAAAAGGATAGGGAMGMIGKLGGMLGNMKSIPSEKAKQSDNEEDEDE